ncbi:hypothetical protein KY290_027779 [Solanum tuberosum]|uniref:Integrase core domain containing protein n=1 Tax=Solanum tuberosum TaxID=4113 RepID=A0ABQ7UG41_SOLTU|nr:hypothetical protein KY290_027779 [Solanum tuberosum]
MVIGVSRILRNWWKDIKRNRELETRELPGGLTSLISVESDRHLIKVGGFLDLPYKKCEKIVPHKPSPREFTCSAAKWEIYRLNAFAIALLGSLVYPILKGKIHTSLCYVVRMMARGKLQHKKAIVSMLLAEIIRALSACTKGTKVWFMYLRGLSSVQIQWKYYWLRPRCVIIREQRIFCTPEYYVWILEDAEHRDLSEGGLPGFGDERARRWARNLLNYDYDITPEMREQVVPNIETNLIEVVFRVLVPSALLTHDYHESESCQKDILIKAMSERLDKLASTVQHVEGRKRLRGLSYQDLYIHPDVELLEGYKHPKFEMFNGIGDPKAHLYPRKWVEWVNMATDFMNKFGFNVENASDWIYIQNLKKRLRESFWDYAIRWRSEATRARPAMEDRRIHLASQATREITAATQTHVVVQRRAPFEVEVVMPRPPFIVHRAPPPIKYDTYVVPWDYGKGKAKMEETDVAIGMTRSRKIYTSENLVQGSSSKSKPPIVELEEQETHPNALMKALGEVYVSASITHEREREHHIYAVEGQDHLDREMFHMVELVGNIEVQPRYSQKIIEMMLWFSFELGKEWIDWQPLIEKYYYPLRKLIPPLHQSFRSIGFMSSITDDVLQGMKGLSLTKEEEKSCNAVYCTT